LAADRAVGKAYFYTANTYELPFRDASFDAVFAHSLLVHLREPLTAIEEMRRVLKPDGVLGIVDSDYGARIWSPSTPLFDQFQKLFLRVLEYNGASLYYARHQRSLLRKAGFAQTVGYSSSIGFGTVEATRLSAAAWEECAHTPAFVETVLTQGWADEAMLEAMRSEIRDWAERPDAFNALLTCAAIGRGRR
jgi:SAM-dependent methyltransferase